MAVTQDKLAGRYRLTERLASGGMGEVWKARDEELGRAVAVKLMRPDLAGDAVAVERFRREARASSALTHPNVASVYDFVSEDGHLGIVMELVEGGTLGARLRRGPLPVDEAAPVADGILAALEAAHAAGMVHRDITPGNVLLAEGGAVKVADFGIAAVEAETTGHLTDTGAVIGTAHYLAPEQVRGERATAAADQYAAGVVIYEMLAGRRPFEADSPAAAAMARLHGPPVPLHEVRPDVPPAVSDVVMRALQLDPAHRHASVGEMRVAMDAAVRSPGRVAAPDAVTESLKTRELTHPITPAPLPPPAPPRRHEHRRLLLVGLAIGALVGLAAALAMASGGGSRPEVPDVVGMQVAAARQVLESEGLEPEVRRVDAEAARGRVLDQSLPVGLRVEEGTTVELEVSTGTAPCCEVPQVEGMPEDAARAALAEVGLSVGSLDRAESSFPEGTVVDQSPGAGEFVEPGTPVALVVSGGEKGKDEDKDEGRGKGKEGRGDDDDD